MADSHTSAPAVLTTDPQSASPLFCLLPQEVRDAIYYHLFSPMELSCKTPPTRLAVPLFYGEEPRPPLHPVAILRTCRRAHVEIGYSWLGLVLLDFQYPEWMLDVLAALPPSALSRVRHVRVPDRRIVLKHCDWQNPLTYGLLSQLALLPGLRLDTLTVRGLNIVFSGHEMLKMIAGECSGWREVRFISQTSDVLAFPVFRYPGANGEMKEIRRKPQPAHWQSILEARDGTASRPSVALYRATDPTRPISPLDPETYEPFEQKVPTDPGEREAFGVEMDEALRQDSEWEKNVMIVMKRGEGVDYEMRADTPLMTEDIRRDIPERTWGEIRPRYINFKKR